MLLACVKLLQREVVVLVELRAGLGKFLPVEAEAGVELRVLVVDLVALQLQLLVGLALPLRGDFLRRGRDVPSGGVRSGEVFVAAERLDRRAARLKLALPGALGVGICPAVHHLGGVDVAESRRLGAAVVVVAVLDDRLADCLAVLAHLDRHRKARHGALFAHVHVHLVEPRHRVVLAIIAIHHDAVGLPILGLVNVALAVVELLPSLPQSLGHHVVSRRPAPVALLKRQPVELRPLAPEIDIACAHVAHHLSGLLLLEGLAVGSWRRAGISYWRITSERGIGTVERLLPRREIPALGLRACRRGIVLRHLLRFCLERGNLGVSGDAVVLRRHHARVAFAVVVILDRRPKFLKFRGKFVVHVTPPFRRRRWSSSQPSGWKISPARRSSRGRWCRIRRAAPRERRCSHSRCAPCRRSREEA